MCSVVHDVVSFKRGGRNKGLGACGLYGGTVRHGVNPCTGTPSRPVVLLKAVSIASRELYMAVVVIAVPVVVWSGIVMGSKRS